MHPSDTKYPMSTWFSSYFRPNGEAGQTKTSRPQLIPMRFRANQMRKQFHYARRKPSWSEWCKDNIYTIALLLSICALMLILYLKRLEKQRGQKKHEPNYTSTLSYSPITSTTWRHRNNQVHFSQDSSVPQKTRYSLLRMNSHKSGPSNHHPV